jgi:hypothetical protein
MNGQYLMNKPITVSYAFKKDGKGERHGSAAGSYFFLQRFNHYHSTFDTKTHFFYYIERLLAAQAKKNQSLPNRLFADVRPPSVPPPMIGVRAQIPAPPQQINTGMSRSVISPSIVSPTNVYGGYHAPGTNAQTTTQPSPRPSIINGAQGMTLIETWPLCKIYYSIFMSSLIYIFIISSPTTSSHVWYFSS